MPEHIDTMGLVGISYFRQLSPYFYFGPGAYGSVNGSQGGLFTLGMEGGVRLPLYRAFSAELGLYVGGGGGHSSLVGGGLMTRTHAGFQYDFSWVSAGIAASYTEFPTGKIHSTEIAVNLDVPYNFYHIACADVSDGLINANNILLSDGLAPGYQRNDFALLMQGYLQPSGIHDADGNIENSNIGLVGAEIDHYLTKSLFGYVKAAGAFHGMSNGYMDILGGAGLHLTLNDYGLALVPQFGVGAGGGGYTDTGGGILLQPQLGVEFPITQAFAARFSGGYVWAPQGTMKATTVTAEILYHLNLATGTDTPASSSLWYSRQCWRISFQNQTYLHPQHADKSSPAPDNLLVLQIDQFFSPSFFFTYQAASAWQGPHAGGLASGMIGPGLQTDVTSSTHLFAQLLIGAEGGGGLALGSGAIIEPVAGLHYDVTPDTGLSASAGQVRALQNDLHTAVFNLGITIRFGTLNKRNQ